MGSRREIIGVTGVIGSGKSTVCRILEKKFRFRWIDADKVVHELYRPGQPGYQKIKDYFGTQFVGKKGVHRGRLRRFVLKQAEQSEAKQNNAPKGRNLIPQKLWILNKIIHPLVVHEVNKKIVQYKNCRICIEAVYFDPADLGKFIDRLVIIDVPDEKILKRLSKRKIPHKQLMALLKFQRKNLSRHGILIKNTEYSLVKLEKQIEDCGLFQKP